MEAPPLQGKIGSLKTLIAADVPGYLTPESHSDLMNAAMVGALEKFLELWDGVNLNFQAVWSSESSKELKKKYIVDHPNLIKEMQDVIAGSALPAVQKGRTALHMAASNGQAEIVRYICAVPGINVNVQDQFGFTPLHLAAHSPDHDDQRVCVIKELLNVRNINPDEKDMHGKIPFSIAKDKHDYRIVVLLQSCFERTSNKRKAYANAANAILVGAALLATVTFTAWLTLPVVGDSQLFWVFNSLCFYFAISTFLAAATASMPTKGPPLALAETAVVAASFCLAFSIAFAVCAFATIGFTIIPQNIKYRRDVISTTICGGLLCLAFLTYFIPSLLGFCSPILFYIDFQFNALCDTVIMKPLMDTNLVKHASRWLNLRYIFDY